MDRFPNTVEIRLDPHGWTGLIANDGAVDTNGKHGEKVAVYKLEKVYTLYIKKILVGGL